MYIHIYIYIYIYGRGEYCDQPLNYFKTVLDENIYLIIQVDTTCSYSY